MLAHGDVDGDRDVDLAVTDRQGLSLLLNDGWASGKLELAIMSPHLPGTRASWFAILAIFAGPATQHPLFAQDPRPGGARVRYEFAGAALTRVAGDRREAIGCTEPGGTGEIHAIARGPHGTVYVAAARGLFSVCDDVRHTTPLTLREWTPGGEPTWVGIESCGTIWLQTREGFGCIEPVHLFGQPHEREPGFDVRVDLGGDGNLRLSGPAGTRRYRPGAGPEPSLEILHADRTPVGGSLHIRVRATTRGRPVFGWRDRKRHRFRYQRSPDFELSDLEPGAHELDFVVFDQDLRRSKAQRLPVSVPYPKTYSKAVALPVILISAFVVLGLLLLSAQRGGGGRGRYRVAILSTFLILVFGLQLLAGLIPHGRGWPFVGFDMYSSSHVEGEHVYRAVIKGVAMDGRVFPFDPIAIGFPSDGYWQALLPLVYDGDEQCRRFVDAYNARRPHAKIRGFVIHDAKHRLTSEGPIEVAPVVMRVYPEGVVR